MNKGLILANDSKSSTYERQLLFPNQKDTLPLLDKKRTCSRSDDVGADHLLTGKSTLLPLSPPTAPQQGPGVPHLPGCKDKTRDVCETETDTAGDRDRDRVREGSIKCCS